jgi:hypothetical protein
MAAFGEINRNNAKKRAFIGREWRFQRPFWGCFLVNNVHYFLKITVFIIVGCRIKVQPEGLSYNLSYNLF